MLSVQLTAQTSPSPSAATQPQPAATKSDSDQLVDELVEHATALHATLPSMTAHEAIQSEASRGILRSRSEAEGTVRAVRRLSGGTLKESHEITVNGKPLAPDAHKGPAILSDGFISSQDMFFAPRIRPCFSFALSPQPAKDGPLELRIALSPNYASLPNCPPGLEGLTGIVRVDPTTHQVTHLERIIPSEASIEVTRIVPFASTDYAPANIGDKTFWLPILSVSSWVEGKVKLHSVVHFSDYHQYTATSTILPANPEQIVP